MYLRRRPGLDLGGRWRRGRLRGRGRRGRGRELGGERVRARAHDGARVRQRAGALGAARRARGRPARRRHALLRTHHRCQPNNIYITTSLILPYEWRSSYKAFTY